MYYHGQEMNLREYVECRISEDHPKRNDWQTEESLIHFIEDYYSSMGEFDEDDLEFLMENGFEETDFTNL